MHDCGFTDFPTNAFVEGCIYLFLGLSGFDWGLKTNITLRVVTV